VYGYAGACPTTGPCPIPTGFEAVTVP